MVDGILPDASYPKGKVKDSHAGAEIAEMSYIGYELAVMERSIHVYGDCCNADIQDGEYRYLVIPLDLVRGIESKDLSDRDRCVQIHGPGGDVTLYSENQSSLSKDLRRVFLLLSRLLVWATQSAGRQPTGRRSVMDQSEASRPICRSGAESGNVSEAGVLIELLERVEVDVGIWPRI